VLLALLCLQGKPEHKARGLGVVKGLNLESEGPEPHLEEGAGQMLATFPGREV
jgi:hypothetical protein